MAFVFLPSKSLILSEFISTTPGSLSGLWRLVFTKEAGFSFWFDGGHKLGFCYLSSVVMKQDI